MNQLMERIKELTSQQEETHGSETSAEEINVNSIQLTLRKGSNKLIRHVVMPEYMNLFEVLYDEIFLNYFLQN